MILKHCLICISLVLLFRFSESRHFRPRGIRNPSASVTSSVVNDKVQNHMKLARLTNGVYLQIELTKKSITVDDIVKGIWNFRNETMTQLVSMKIEDLQAQLAALTAALKAVPDGSVADEVKKATEKFKPLADLRKGLGSVKAALDYSNVPDIATASSNIPYLKDIKAPKVCFDFLTKIQNANGNTKTSGYSTLCNKAATCTSNILGIKIEVETSIKQLDAFLAQDADDRALGHLTAGVRVVQGFASSSAAFKDLAQNGKKMEDLFGNYNQLLALPKTNPKLQVVLEFLKQLTDSIRSPKSSPDTVGAAFTRDQSLERVFEDLKDPWVLTVLNNGKSLGKLEDGLNPLRKLSDHLGRLSRNFMAFSKEQALDALASVNQLHSLLETVDPSKFSTIFAVPTCLGELNTTQAPKEADYIVKLSEQLRTLEEPIKELKAEVEKIKVDSIKLKQLRDSIETHLGDLTKPIDPALFQFGIDHSTELAKQVDAVNAVFSKYPQLAALQPLNGTNEMDEVKKWIVESKLSDGSTCDLQSLDESIIHGIGAFAGAVENVKSGQVLAQVKSIETAVADSLQLLEIFRSSKYDEDEKAKQISTLFSSEKVPGLLDVAIGMETLRELEHVYMAKTDMQAVMGAEKTVSVAIQKNTNHQDKLKTVWNGFGSVSKMLAAFGSLMDELEKTVEKGEEKTLEEVCAVYSLVARMKIDGKISLTSFVDSFPLFESTGNDMKALQKAFGNVDQPALQDFNLAFARFQKVSPSLQAFHEQLAGLKSGGSDYVIIIIIVVIIILVIALIAALIASGVYFHCCHKKEYVHIGPTDMDVASGKGPKPEPYYNYNDSPLWKFNHVQMQDAFFGMNKKTGLNTKLYNAVLEKNYAVMVSLIKKGAVIDATNGPLERTAFFELLMSPEYPKKREHLKLFYQSGASIYTHDMQKKDANLFGDKYGYKDLFDKWVAQRKQVKYSRKLPPKTPRKYNILVIDPNAMTRWRRRLLSPIIKNRITWGYNFDENDDLDQYTHIVLPKVYRPIEFAKFALGLDDDDFFRWRLVACLANLMNDEWLEATIKDPKKIMFEQDFMILDMVYRADTYKDSLLQLKSATHRLLPKLLRGVKVTFLSTKDVKEMKKQVQWMKVVKLFGGELTKVPVSDPKAKPYHAMSDCYGTRYGAQNSSWIIKYPDSEIRPEWQQIREFTLVPLVFIPTCIAGYRILPTCNNKILVEAVDREDAPEPSNNEDNTYAGLSEQGEVSLKKKKKQEESSTSASTRERERQELENEPIENYQDPNAPAQDSNVQPAENEAAKNNTDAATVNSTAQDTAANKPSTSKEPSKSTDATTTQSTVQNTAAKKKSTSKEPSKSTAATTTQSTVQNTAAKKKSTSKEPSKSTAATTTQSTFQPTKAQKPLGNKIAKGSKEPIGSKEPSKVNTVSSTKPLPAEQKPRNG